MEDQQPGKYFYISSAMHDKVVTILDPTGGAAGVVCDKRSTEDDLQLWYTCPQTGVTRSKADPTCCLDCDESSYIVLAKVTEDKCQIWELEDGFLMHKETQKAMDICNQSMAEGEKIMVYEKHGNINQKWTKVHQPVAYFCLESDLNSKVLDIAMAKKESGAKVVVWEPASPAKDNQLWCEDLHGVIRSKLNNFALDTSDGTLRMQQYDDQRADLFYLFDDVRRCIFKMADMAGSLDIKNADSENCEICHWKWKDGSNQKWNKKYV